MFSLSLSLVHGRKQQSIVRFCLVRRKMMYAQPHYISIPVMVIVNFLAACFMRLVDARSLLIDKASYLSLSLAHRRKHSSFLPCKVVRHKMICAQPRCISIPVIVTVNFIEAWIMRLVDARSLLIDVAL